MTPRLHQFLTGATSGDAITNQALLLRGWLRSWGVVSDIFAEHIHASMESEVRPLAAYRPATSRPQRHTEWVIYRHSIGSSVPDFLLRQGVRLLLIYHNVTPPEFFAKIDPAWAQMARLGQQQLRQLRDRTGLALADSPFNAQDLHTAGYAPTAVLPITLDESRYVLPSNPELAAHIAQTGPNLLFVSRLAPNKKQEDLVKLLYYLRRRHPQAHLHLVGDRWEIGYDRWVEKLAAELGLANHVTLTGKLTQQDMVTYYRTADLYVSMSEHEGFGMPLLEAMYLGLPILAYGTTAVPHTLGDSGVLFYQKDYSRLAELVDILFTHRALGQRLIARQKERVQVFSATAVGHTLHQLLTSHNVL